MLLTFHHKHDFISSLIQFPTSFIAIFAIHYKDKFLLSLQHPSQPWRPAFRPYHASIPPSDSPTLPPALIYTLQSRSLTERDYELLLQLDNPQSQDHTHTIASGPATVDSSGVQERRGRVIPERIINSFHVEPVDSDSPLLQNGTQCGICSGGYQRGDWVRKLPCKHKVQGHVEG